MTLVHAFGVEMLCFYFFICIFRGEQKKIILGLIDVAAAP